LSSQIVARRYASALADVVIERAEQALVREELAAWERLLQGNPPLLEVFRNPTVPYEQKVKVLDELITRTRVRATAANFLRILLRNQRLTELSQVNVKLVQVLDERAGVVSALVISARPVADVARAALEEKLKQVTGKKVRLNFGTDQSLLGGIVTRIGSTVYDGSVRNQLSRLGEQLAG
jgi:F-type H+-transporting ATPase subunit delta